MPLGARRCRMSIADNVALQHQPLALPPGANNAMSLQGGAELCYAGGVLDWRCQMAILKVYLIGAIGFITLVGCGEDSGSTVTGASTTGSTAARASSGAGGAGEGGGG